MGEQLDDHQRRVGQPRHAVISIVRRGDKALTSARCDPARSTRRSSPDSWRRARTRPARRPRRATAAPLITGAGAPADWDAPVPGTGRRGVRRRRRRRWRGVSRGRHAVRVRPPRGGDDVPGHARPVCGGASPSRRVRWRSTPNATAPARGWGSARPTSSTCRPIRCSRSCRRGWAGRARTVSLPAGRYETLMPPSTVADMMIYLAWIDGRPRRAGGPHCVLGARWRHPGGGAAHRAAADAVLGSRRRRAWSVAVRRGGEFVGDGVGVRQRHGRSAASTGSATG